MFAPRPEVAISEMRRVLKPTGRIAFATWPPEHFVGKFFSFIGRNSPPPPPGASPPPQWGIPAVIAERLGTKFEAPFFERKTMQVPALSLQHFRSFMERSVGPVQKLVESLANDPQKLSELRREFDALAALYYHGNVVHQAGGHTAERVEMKEVAFHKTADLSSPILAQTCAMGKTLPKVTFEFMRADGNGKPICYFRMELRNVLIGGVEPGIEPGALLGEHVSLKYSEMVWKYTQQMTSGGTGGSTVGSWDCAANRVAT